MVITGMVRGGDIPATTMVVGLWSHPPPGGIEPPGGARPPVVAEPPMAGHLPEPPMDMPDMGMPDVEIDPF